MDNKINAPDPDPDKVCEECFKETLIHYDYGSDFWGPRLKSITQLYPGNIGLVHNPIGRLGEWLYQRYDDIHHVLMKLDKWLFPRREKIWGNVIDSYFCGRVVYASRYTPRTPMVHVRVECWARTRWFFQWRLIAAGHTDENGDFHLPFDLRAVRNPAIMTKVHFEIHHTSHIYFDQEQKPKPVYKLYHAILFPKTDLIGMGYNLREIPLDLWKYRTDTDIPRAMITDPDGDATQTYSEGRLDALFEQIIPIEVIKEKHLIQIRDFPETISIADIQKDYPENLTVCIEKKLPGYTRGDAWFGKRMMNGMNCGSFMPDKDNPEQYWIKYFGICDYDHNDEYALPDVDIKFKIDEKTGYPVPIEIHTTGALNAINKDIWQKRVFTPADGPLWLAAKRIARVNGAVSTEVDEHFTGTHLNTEQYAIAAFRNFHLSPLSCLLFPHLKEVVLINAAADQTIIAGYLPTATALSEQGLIARTRDMLGTHDWVDWKPMTPLTPKHTYALAENLFWGIVHNFVEQFIAENEAAIKEQWLEVYLFSKDLVEHSVPVFLSETNWNALGPEEKRQADARREYYSFLCDFDFNRKREVINGKVKTISPITHSKVYDESKPEEFENLKKVCKYAIMMATFMHTWINEQQYDDLGEILYSCGGLRFGSSETGVLGPESDLHIAPDLTRATQMLWFTNFLSRTEYGFITRNEEGDVNPIFQKLLKDKTAEFKSLGVDVNDIESRTNI